MVVVLRRACTAVGANELYHLGIHYLHSLASVRPSVRPPVCLSVCLSHLSTDAAACGRFAAVGSAGRRNRLIAARRACSRCGRLSIHVHSSTAVISKCEQCHVFSRHRRLNKDLSQQMSTAINHVADDSIVFQQYSAQSTVSATESNCCSANLANFSRKLRLQQPRADPQVH